MPKKPKRKIKQKSAKQMVVVRDLPPPRNMLELIERAARDPAVDTGKMKALLDMKYEEERRNAEIAYSVAMETAQTTMPLVLKDAENPQTHSFYAKLENLSRVVDPVIHENGFSLSYGMGESNLPNHYRITCLVLHKSGHHKEYFYDLPMDDVGPKGNPNKTAVHAVASTTQYARRYLKTMIFDIRIAGMDDDGNKSAYLPISEPQLKALRQKIKDTGADEKKVCEFAKVDSIDKIPVHFLGSVALMLDQRAKMKAGATA